MNSETRMPASRKLATTARVRRAGRQRRARLRWCAPRVAPARGRRRAAWSRSRSRPSRSVAAISKIERLCDLRLEPRHVLVADMPAILAQMRGDAVGAGRDGDLRRAHRIRMPSATRIADGRDVVDVDAEPECRRRHLRSLRDGCSESSLICPTLISRDSLNQAIVSVPRIAPGGRFHAIFCRLIHNESQP